MSLVMNDILALLKVSSRTGEDLAVRCRVKIGTVRHAVVKLRKAGYRIIFMDGYYRLLPDDAEPVVVSGLNEAQKLALENLDHAPRRVIYQLRKLGYPIRSLRGAGYRL